MFYLILTGFILRWLKPFIIKDFSRTNLRES